MWSDTVTIYRENDGKMERIIANGCRIEMKMEISDNILGGGRKKKCFLALPAETAVYPGDRVVAGAGPEEVPEDAVRLTVVRPCYLHGALHHTEAEG